MKVGGGLNFVTGPMGSGKSLFAVRKIIAAVTSGSYAVTNVSLREGWEHRVAFHIAPWRAPTRRRHLADRFHSLYVPETDLAEARRYRVPGKGEGRGLFVWDEGHNDLNNRKWKDDGRAELLTWATQLRKLGFVGYLLTQHADNTDAALRRIANHTIRLQNQREQTRVLGVRVSPWPLFLAYWYPAHLGLSGQRIQPVRTERYFLTWHRHLYDTMDLFHGLATDSEEHDNAIWLPTPAALGELPRSGSPRAALEAPAAPSVLPVRLEGSDGLS